MISYLLLLYTATLFALLISANDAIQPAIAENKSCHDRRSTTIAFVGDLIFQDSLQETALRTGGSYSHFWSGAERIFRHVDAVFGNLEGTLASGISYNSQHVVESDDLASSPVYRSPPDILNFNYYHTLAQQLYKSGFRVVSTANNHAFDRGAIGVQHTLERLKEAGISAVGTRSTEIPDHRWGQVVRFGELNAGWVACTYGINGHSDPNNQVLECYRERQQVLATISELAAKPDVNAVFFVPHWGIENHRTIARRQRYLARDAAVAGATIIVGTHPHVLQTWERLPTQNKNSIVIYSTGNLVSAQPRPEHRRGIILLVRLQAGGKKMGGSQVIEVRYVATEFDLATQRLSLINLRPDERAILPTTAHLDIADVNTFFTKCSK